HHEASTHPDSGDVCRGGSGSGARDAGDVRRCDAGNGVDGSWHEERLVLRREAQGVYAGVRRDVRRRAGDARAAAFCPGD
ncbi:hypothetical protein, partial [Escherichia coli]